MTIEAQDNNPQKNIRKAYLMVMPVILNIFKIADPVPGASIRLSLTPIK
jgi:hypothetical protein